MDDKNSQTSPLRLVEPLTDASVVSVAEFSPSAVSLPTEGPDLVQTVVSLTGLPEDMVGLELQKVLEQNGCSEETLTLDELRNALLVYLETFKGDLCDLEKSEDAPH